MNTAARPPFAAADWRSLGCAVRLAVTEPTALAEARRALVAWLAEVDAACSRFRADSEIVALDRSQGRFTPVSEVLAEAVAAALRAAEQTSGDVDPTVGSALAALGYDRDFTLVEQDGAPLKLVVRPVPGWQRIGFDPERRMLGVPAGIRLDLGATAKAWAADRAAADLAEAFGCGILVGLGGDVAVAGPAPRDGWTIRVQDRTDDPDPDAPHTAVVIRDGGLATSGTAARRWSRGGAVLHHIVDPRTGLPAHTPWRTVSVTAATCLDANIASTAAVIRGAAAPAWLTERGLDARLVAEDGTVRTVGRWPAERTGDREPVVRGVWTVPVAPAVPTAPTVPVPVVPVVSGERTSDRESVMPAALTVVPTALAGASFSGLVVAPNGGSSWIPR